MEQLRQIINTRSHKAHMLLVIIIAVKFCARNSRENVDKNLRNAVCSFELCILFAGIIKDVFKNRYQSESFGSIESMQRRRHLISFVEAAGDSGGRAENDDNVNMFLFTC